MIELYKANVSEDTSINGGEITDNVIESGVMHELITKVRSFDAEIGVERYFKFFIKNTSNQTLYNVGISLTNYTTGADEVYLFEGSSSDVEDELNKESLKLYGTSVITAKGNTFLILDKDVSQFINANDVVTVYSFTNEKMVSATVIGSDSNTLTLENAIPSTFDIVGKHLSSTVMVEEIGQGETKGLWIKQVVPSYCGALENNTFTLNAFYDTSN